MSCQEPVSSSCPRLDSHVFPQCQTFCKSNTNNIIIIIIRHHDFGKGLGSQFSKLLKWWHFPMRTWRAQHSWYKALMGYIWISRVCTKGSELNNGDRQWWGNCHVMRSRVMEKFWAVRIDHISSDELHMKVQPPDGILDKVRYLCGWATRQTAYCCSALEMPGPYLIGGGGKLKVMVYNNN